MPVPKIGVPETKTGSEKRYISVDKKFWIGHSFALVWMIFSIIISLPWLNDLSQIISMPLAILVIAGIGYIPGYINAFIVVSLLLDRQPPYKTLSPNEPVTIVIACMNEEKVIANTLCYVKNQDYIGEIQVIVVDNASSDKTSIVDQRAGERLGLDLKVLYEENPGKYNALNKALGYIKTDYAITLDADTLLHRSAVRYIVSRIKSAPENVCAVAGAVLVRNSRQNLLARLQEWDYFLGIASIKRMQGLYQGTLVAQGAFSIYKVDALKLVDGWPNAIGEDIVLTWNFLKNGLKVYFEPLAVAFTEVPITLRHLARQRSRWARGMIEALKIVKPWQHPIKYVRYLTGINLVMPFLDIVFTFCWMPGLILALFGIFWIVGPMTLFVLPLALVLNYILYNYQRYVFRKLELRIRKNFLGFILYVLIYQMLMSPMSVWGYIQELFLLKRVWK
ncbi:glycosyltransferase family 2 protein [Desulfofalx alkaliphila]|uniref:glycosyltransferase family 2 protein n=1 Tax=Desulfofalx alkaliphila TaxID=105483 RepID=UPI0004E17CBF|nr:glycosyltransferase [Desulfofalx alkaliphila]